MFGEKGKLLFCLLVLITACGKNQPGDEYRVELSEARKFYQAVDPARDQQAQAILSQNCAACHSYANSVQTMIQTGRLVPGNAQGSPIYQRISQGSMPPSGPLPSSVVTLIMDWINIDLANNPTPAPTAVPTMRPTPAPTAVPTTRPTPVPTAMPTMRPTPAPTAVPTMRPTPTPRPTLAPRPTPTPQSHPGGHHPDSEDSSGDDSGDRSAEHSGGDSGDHSGDGD